MYAIVRCVGQKVASRIQARHIFKTTVFNMCKYLWETRPLKGCETWGKVCAGLQSQIGVCVPEPMDLRQREGRLWPQSPLFRHCWRLLEQDICSVSLNLSFFSLSFCHVFDELADAFVFLSVPITIGGGTELFGGGASLRKACCTYLVKLPTLSCTYFL